MSAAAHLQRRLKKGVERLGLSERGQDAIHIYQMLEVDEPDEDMVRYVDWLLHWTHASSSQLKSLDRCERYWWYNKVAKLQTESTAALERGTKIHKQLEIWLNQGVYPEDTAAQALVPLLPQPTPGLPNGPHRPYQVEHQMHLTLPGAPVPIIGAIDLLRPGHVVDFKSTKSLEYALTPDRLKHDRQAKIYCLAERARTPGLEYYRAEWMYTVTSGASQAQAHAYSFTNEELDEVVPSLTTALTRMHALTQIASGSGVPPTGIEQDNCYLYNRPCDFKDLCRAENGAAPTLSDHW